MASTDELCEKGAVILPHSFHLLDSETQPQFCLFTAYYSTEPAKSAHSVNTSNSTWILGEV